MTWYAAGLALAFVFASRKDRSIWLILFVFATASVALQMSPFGDYQSPIKHLVITAIEAAKVSIIASYCIKHPNRLGVFQCFCLFAAAIVNYLLYIDLTSGQNLINDRYETTIYTIAVFQLIPATDGVTRTIANMVRRVLGARSILGSPYRNRLAIGDNCSQKGQEGRKG